MLKLNQQSKASFLKHLLWKDANSYDNKRSTKRFLKFFIISNGFLNASRPKDVCKFVLRTNNVHLYEYEDESTGTASVCLIPGRYTFEDQSIYMTFENTVRMFQLLKPQLLQLQLNDGMPQQVIEEYSNLVEEIKGRNLLNKLGIALLGHNQSIHDIFIKKSLKQINELECDIDLMIKENLYPQLELDYYVARKMKNFVQLKDLLKRHKITKLHLGMFSQFFNGNEDKNLPLDPQEIESAKNVRFLELEHRRGHYRLKKTVEKLLKIFPNLMSLHVISVSDTDNTDPEEFLDELEEVYELTSKLQKECKKSVQKVSFDVMLRGYCENRKSLSKMFQKHKQFKNFKFIQQFCSVDNHSLSNVFEFIDWSGPMEFRTWVTCDKVTSYDNEIRYHRLGRGAPELDMGNPFARLMR